MRGKGLKQRKYFFMKHLMKVHYQQKTSCHFERSEKSDLEMLLMISTVPDGTLITKYLLINLYKTYVPTGLLVWKE